jgi:hypothetical protein
MGGGHEDHGGTVEHAKMKKKKTIRIAHRPDNHESEHPETHWELFYDLILVVVFMRLRWAAPPGDTPLTHPVAAP